MARQSLSMERFGAWLLADGLVLMAALSVQAQGVPGAVGYNYGPWSVYQSPYGPMTGYQYGPWSVYQTPFGPVTGYRHGRWSVYQSPYGTATGYRYGPWTVYSGSTAPSSTYPPRVNLDPPALKPIIPPNQAPIIAFPKQFPQP